VAPATGMTPLIDELVEHGHEFSFVQVMRLARRYLDSDGEAGIPGIPWQERVRIRPELSLAFPAADVAKVERDDGNLRVTATFLGLYGPSSPLPTFYTEDLMEESSNDESVFRDFLDIIHQRLYHLYFQCWSKYRLLIRIVEENNPIDRERLLCLIGLGEKELVASVPEAFTLLRYTGILSQYPRSATGLATMLRDMLGMKDIRIMQNVKRMVPIPDDQRMRLGLGNCRLGIDTVLGSHIADRMGRFRIRIGPLTWQEYNDLLPGTPRMHMLTRYTRFYLTDPLEVEVELVLASGEARPIRLGDPGSRLGLNMWCFSGDTLGEVSAVFRMAAQPEAAMPAAGHDPAPRQSRRFVDLYREERAALDKEAARYVEGHPDLAPLMSGPLADQGVERLLEGTAFLNALLQQKLADDFPEFIHEVMGQLEPEHLRPVPAMTIIAFTPKEGFTQAQVIPAGAEVASIPVQGTTCRFRTCYDVTVHPLTLLDASFAHPPGKAPCITLQFEVHGVGLSGLKPGALRLFLGDDYPSACDLYLVLMRHVRRIFITAHGSNACIELPPDSLKPVGFAEEEAMLTGSRSFMPGHLLLQEYFLYHYKFLFIDLTGVERCSTLGRGDRFDIRFELAGNTILVPPVSAKSIVLSATPVINLFAHKAEPVSFAGELRENAVQPAGKDPDHYRIYSVDRVEGLVKSTSSRISYRLHGPSPMEAEGEQVCHLTQAASVLKDGFDTFLSISSDKSEDERIQLDIDLTCTNGIFPQQLALGDICLASSGIPEAVGLENIKNVTGSDIPRSQRNRQWRVFSGFSLNNISLSSAENLRALLRVYNNVASRRRAAAAANANKIDAIQCVEVIPADRLIGRCMYRGYDVRMKLSADGFTGPGDMYLFGTVLERFLGGYVTQNCYMRLMVEEVGNRYRFEWPARMGDRVLM